MGVVKIIKESRFLKKKSCLGGSNTENPQREARAHFEGSLKSALIAMLMTNSEWAQFSRAKNVFFKKTFLFGRGLKIKQIQPKSGRGGHHLLGGLTKNRSGGLAQKRSTPSFTHLGRYGKPR